MNILSRPAEEDKLLPTANSPAEAVVESATRPGVSDSDSSALSPAQRLKLTISFRALAESDGLNFKSSGKRWLCRCPFHPDRTPSFSIHEDDDRATCYGCGWYGDIFKYVMDRTGCTFGSAFHHLAQMPTLADTKTKRLPRASKERDAEHVFTDSELNEIERSTSWIIRDAGRCASIALARGWSPKTILKLAEGKHLGWGGDALNFIYKTGIKVREWPGKRFYWWAGGPHLWRADRLKDASVIYLTEGEPDAITLLDSGFENESGSAVIAAPSASTFSRDWAKLFSGKEVTVCYDADDAGRSGAANVGSLLAPIAEAVFTLDLKEVA